MVSNTENVFYIITDVTPNTSDFRLVSYQSKTYWKNRQVEWR